MRLTPKNLVWIVATIVVAAGWFVALRPTSMGGDASYVMIRGTSMLPTYEGGDLVVTRKASSYRKGDIVAYRVPKSDAGAGIVVIHRITGGDPKEGFVIQGDNNEWRDEWSPKPDDIVGKARLRIPKLGLVFAFLHAPVPLAGLAASLAFVFVLFPKKRIALAEPEVEAAVAGPYRERPYVLAVLPYLALSQAPATRVEPQRLEPLYRTVEEPALADAA